MPALATVTGCRVRIGERALYLDCRGHDGLTVVLEGGTTLDWAMVQPEIAAIARVCSYDRSDSPGSRNDPTPEEFSSRLRSLVASLGTPVPVEPSEVPPTAQEISFDQMRAARSDSTFPSMPLVVLTHGRADDPAERLPGWPLGEEEQIWRELHEELVCLAPNGRHVVAAGIGHNIHQERPELVIKAIHRVVATIRDSMIAVPAS